MIKILLFVRCVSVCVSVCQSVRRVCVLNAYSFTMVKAKDLKFDVYVPRDSPNVTP